MKIKFVTDFVCPYCIVAKKALFLAAEQLGIGIDFETIPFELTPVNKPQVDTYNDPVRREHYKVLEQPCRQLGLSLYIPPYVVPRPYTHSAFEGYYYCKTMNLAEYYADEVYHAYFADEKDIGDVDVLASLMKDYGVNPDDFKKHLSDYSLQVDHSNDYSKNVLKVRSVPTIYIDDELVNPSEYTIEAFKEILQQKSTNENGFIGCGEDGCNF